MSVRPITFNPDGSIDVLLDELGHSGTIPADKVFWISDPVTGEDNHNFIVLDCPDGCGSRSTHPVGGGADAPHIQEMFVRKVNAEGCVCPAMKDTQMTFSTAVEHVKKLVEEMDGEGRWQVDEVRLERELNAAQ